MTKPPSRVTDGDASNAVDKSREEKNKKHPASPSPEFVRVRGEFDRLFATAYGGAKAQHSGNSDKKLKALLKAQGEPEVTKRLLVLFSTSCPTWIDGTKTVGTLCGAFDKLIGHAGELTIQQKIDSLYARSEPS